MESDDMDCDTKPTERLCTGGVEFGNYDVFISHRGPDTKTGFVGFLYEALKRVGLHPFLDCKSISKGQDSWKCIDHAIQTTPLALVIFSESFAQSVWCLKELHAILNSPSMKVLPIFYKVQPWEVNFPENGQLSTRFTKLIERHDKTLVEEWRADMQKASKLHGWEHKVGDQSLEVELVEEVAKKICEFANKLVPLVVGDHIVGVKQVAKNLIQMLDEKKVLMLGLWGMGGIGKSTLARELYNQLGRRFDASCYVGDVVEKVNHLGGVTSIQNHILKALCENESMPNTIDKSQGKGILEERLSKKQILVVLDDVRDDDQMGYLMSRKMLKEGSLCIVTSRDRRVFEKSTSFHLDDMVYTHEVQTLSQQDSRSVFAGHAFGGDWKVPQEFGDLVGDVSRACCGVPLVLMVVGSCLRDEEDVEIWEQVLNKLNCGTIMDEKKIFECLRISYDALNKEYQEMFLDIACALLGESMELAKFVWNSQGWSAPLGIRTLLEKALVRVDKKGDFHMHDHLRDMGRVIARQEKSSMDKRLWESECLALLNKNEPLPISLQTLILPWGYKIRDDLSLMRSLRILKCSDSWFSMSSLPKNLRWLDYTSYMQTQLDPFPKSPENNELVILYWMDNSMVSLPASFGNLNKLKVLNFKWCGKLEELPESFGGLQNLENLNLQGSRIKCLPKSFWMLSKLKVLNLEDCGKLEELPETFGHLQNLENLNLQKSAIKFLPISFGTLSKLKVLNLVCCHKLEDLPCSFGGLQNLEDFYLQGNCAIKCLPKSFGKLSKLKVLNLDDCGKLKELPETFGGLQNLEDLYLQGSAIKCPPESFGMLSKLKILNLDDNCGKLEELPETFGGLQNLEDLNLEGSAIKCLPISFGTLSKLKVLNLVYCHKLEELPDSFGGLQNLEDLYFQGSAIKCLSKSFGMLTELKVLNLGGCGELEELPKSFGGLQNLEVLNLERSAIKCLPKSFGKLNKLKVLNLDDCGKLEELPETFGGLQKLEDLYLQGSAIKCPPESFGMLSKLKVLNLVDCDKLEELPEKFGVLQNLKDLNLQGSAIKCLPKSFGMLSKLKVLNLVDCSKLEELPESFGGLQNLEDLYLQGSAIKCLPKSFGMLSKLKVLNLVDCGKLEELPESFGALQNLEDFNLQGSAIKCLSISFWMLCKLKVSNLVCCHKLGELRDSFGGLQNLEDLYLQGSAIKCLPKFFSTLSKLKVLNLGGCGKLKELPESFGGLQNLEDLNLQGSAIKCLPKSFGMLKLKVLNLVDCKGATGIIWRPPEFG